MFVLSYNDANANGAPSVMTVSDPGDSDLLTVAEGQNA